MPAATLPILVNILVAGMFVASFLTIAHLNPGFRHIRWIAASYALGMLTPLAEFLLPLFSWPAPFMVASYAGLFIGMVVMAPALSLLYGKRPMWSLTVALAVAGLVVRGLVWDGQRNDFFYELAYQIPFAAAASLCSATIAVHGRGTGLDRAAMALFAVIGAHFLLKPFAAVYLGSGATASDYVNTTYSLISQASSGVLLIAAGLVVLINALHMVVLKDRGAAMSDPLTGLPNRRALNDAFERMAMRRGEPVAAIAVLDLDHFKRINDVWGHGAGDEVLCAVARCLEDNRPSDAMIARLGGEEFVLLVPWGNEGLVRLACEKLRLAVARLAFRKVDGVTVSIGATSIARNEDLSAALARADRCLYDAKAAGRDRCIFEPSAPSAAAGIRHALPRPCIRSAAQS